jgi:hypothetical protein
MCDQHNDNEENNSGAEEVWFDVGPCSGKVTCSYGSDLIGFTRTISDPCNEPIVQGEVLCRAHLKTQFYDKLVDRDRQLLHNMLNTLTRIGSLDGFDHATRLQMMLNLIKQYREI